MAFNRKMDWVPCVNFAGSDPPGLLNVNAAESGILSTMLLAPGQMGAGSHVNAVGEPEVIPNDLTVKAVRGSVVFELVSDPSEVGAQTLRVAERIHVVMRDINVAGAITLPITSLFNDQEANESFLWARYHHYEIQGWAGGFSSPLNQGVSYDHPAWSAVEVQSERRVRQGEALVHSVQTELIGSGSWNTLLLRTRPYLRTLVRMR